MERSELFPSTSYENEDSNDMKCGICFETFSLRGLMNGCKHVFCFVCIEKWSQTSNTCPLCKKRFSQLTKVDLMKPNKKGKRIPIANKNQRVAYDDDPAWLADFEEHRNGVSSINWIFNLFGNIISMVQFEEEEGLDIESDLFDSDSSEESEVEEAEAEAEVEVVEEEGEDSIVDLTEHSNDFMDLTIPMSAEIVSSSGFSESRPHIPRRRGHRRSHIYHGTQSYRSIGNANTIDSDRDARSERNFRRPLQRNFQSNQNDMHYPSSHCFHRNNNGNHQSHSNSNISSSTIRNGLNSSNSNSNSNRRRRRNVESISVPRDENSFENSPPPPLPHRNQWRPRDSTRTEHSRTSIHPMEDDHDQQTSYRPTQPYRHHLYSEQLNNASIISDNANGNITIIDNINSNSSSSSSSSRNSSNNNNSNSSSSSGNNNNHVRRSRRGNFVGQSTREARDSIASSTSTISSSLNENTIAHWAPRTGYFRTAQNTQIPLQYDERHRYNTARSQHRNVYQQQQQHHHHHHHNNNNNNHHHYHRDYRNSDNSGVDSNSNSNSSSSNEGNRTLSRGSPFLRY